MSKDTISIQMLIQGRKLTLQQRGDAQKELNNLQSKLSELERENERLRNAYEVKRINKIIFCPLCNTENLHVYSDGSLCCAFC